MNRFRFTQLVCVIFPLIFLPGQGAPAQQTSQSSERFPFPEKLSYRIEWRLVTAGTADLEFTRSGPNRWGINLNLQSAGVVTRLYRVLDKYEVASDAHFCAQSSKLEAEEGKRHAISKMAFDNTAHKVQYESRDLVKNTETKQELAIEPCTHEVAGALASLGELDLLPGHSTFLPITDGKKIASAKVEAQAKETISIDGKTYPTVRYEAFLFDNVLYKRKGRLFVWLTDDPDRTPVQFRIQLGFPIGTISLELEKQQKS